MICWVFAPQSMKMNTWTRRNFLQVAATSLMATWLPSACRETETVSATSSTLLNTELPEAVVWKGVVLGSAAEMRIYHQDRQFAERLIVPVLNEITRLEKMFSLYHPDSLISQLNKQGYLNNPPNDFLSLLSLCQDVYKQSQGAFDPSIQPLWTFLTQHFQHHHQPPSPQALQKILPLIGFDKVVFDSRKIYFTQQGMGISLNGIAQGYITDKIASFLQQAGVEQALLNLGEIYAMDTQGQRVWSVGIQDPQDRQQILRHVSMSNQGLATSSAYGTLFDETGQFSHLFQPKTGNSQAQYQSVSVRANTAALADAWATACSVSHIDDIRRMVQHIPNLSIWLVLHEGDVLVLGEA